ncbi:MAG: hypothetical protein RBT64_09055 [Trichloromonas sp.]|jgi:hypothetical protein|nr:hypothetical protein [Trichloromonas sp.]
MKPGLVPLLLVLMLPAMANQALAASALGQLEGMAGRSINSVNVPMPSNPSMVSSGATSVMSGAAGASRAAATLGAISMGMQLFDILNALDSTSAAKNALQLQEQQRLEQERLRALREQSAEQLRSSWDQADAAHSASLEGALDVPVRAGTAFFGIPGNPSGGVLPGQTATVAPPSVTLSMPTPAPATTARTVVPPRQNPTSYQEMPQSTTEITPSHAEILAKGGKEFTQNAAKDILEKALEKGIALLPNQWKAELIYEHQGKMRHFIDEIFSHLDADRLVKTIVHGTPSEMVHLEQEISRGARQSAKNLVVSDDILEDEEPVFLLKLLRGEKVSAGETWSLIKGRVYSGGIDTTTDRLLFGGG